ncbi:MAG: hypothetical protein KDE27_14890 [Planctomycetes bacterium]|nr:hypothetical protein [Planctomycetota bacterium]
MQVRDISLFLLTSVAGLLPAQGRDSQDKYPSTRSYHEAQAESQHAEAWRQFLDATGGEWIVRWCAATGTPAAIFGTGLTIADWRENSLAEARRHAGALLNERADLLGLGTSEFREVIGSRMGRAWCLVYDQYFGGLPVLGGRADVRVNMTGRVAMFGSKAVQMPANFVTVPQIDELTATTLGWNAANAFPNGVRQPAGQRPVRLVIWADVEADSPTAPVLAWEVPVSAVNAEGVGPIGRQYVDAATGAALQYVNDKHECGVAGCGYDAREVARAANANGPLAPINTTITVMGWTRLGSSAITPLTNIPLPGVEVVISSTTYVTDANGQFTVDLTSATSVTVQLDGRHSRRVAGSSAPSLTQTVTPGVAATFQFFTSGASDAEAAHTSTFYWVDSENEWARGILGNSPELAAADNVLPTVNIGSTCNAYYTNNTINFYSAGGGCNNTGYSSVVLHEWGHGLDDRYGGISQTNGLSEGWADICSLYLLDDPIIGRDFTTSGGFVRDGNNTRQYPTGSGPHAQGESWMGFAWNLRDHMAVTLASRPMAIAITETIVLGSIVADATDQATAVLEVYIADDNDGNLANGVPHSADLDFACNQHSLPIPAGSGPVNDDCGNAVTLTNGFNGPFSNVAAFNSTPAWPCGQGGADIWFVFASGGSGTLTVDTCSAGTNFDTTIEVFSGGCGALTSLACNDDSCGAQSSVSVPVGAGYYHIRVGGFQGATGSFDINVSGPGGGAPATTMDYGQGCYELSKAFYESFGASTIDLNGGFGMFLVKVGDHYTAVPGGTYVAPTAAATQLSLADDSETTLTLASAFPYPGNSTNTLVLCSNGFVSAASGNGTGYVPSAFDWLSSSQPRWGAWHDFNPAATGGGKVFFEEIGTISYMTWNGVYSYGTTAPETFQLQFDRSTGNVTYVFQQISGQGNGYVVGYAATAPNRDLGSLDISAALPGSFSTGDDNSVGLAISSNLPSIGSNLVFTTTEFPTGSTLGIETLSFTQVNPGIDLTSVGMPGCFRYTGTESSVVVIPSGSQATFSVAIPNSGTYIGLGITSQSYALSPGANTLGLISSNGVRAVIGL